jgi:nucleotide-binding universal stress UspA family protein
MLKRILVLMGESPSSEAAREYGFRLARATGAKLAGLAGVDLEFIEAREPVPLGAVAFKAMSDKKLLEEAEQARDRLRERFRDECAERDVEFEWLSFVGDPAATLLLAAETHDLLITGHDTTFRGKTRATLSAMIERLLIESPRPVIVCPDTLPQSGRVLVAYDGSLPSMRSIQMFVLLGIAPGQSVEVVSIDPDQETAARRCSAAATYMRAHGYDVSTFPVASRAHPAEILNVEVAGRDIGTLVMGAYGHRGFREALFGSTTRRLVDEPRCAQFLYH